MKRPCSKCGKLIAKGYASPLPGTFVCKPCLLADPKLMNRLTINARKALIGCGK